MLTLPHPLLSPAAALRWLRSSLRKSAFPGWLAALTLVLLPAATQAQINFSNGFPSGSTTLNGSAVVNGTALQLTDTNTINEAGSAFYPTPVNIQTFTTDFTFRLTNASADGFMFVLQNQGPFALGAYGQFLGYGGIKPSAGIKFDIYNNFGEGNNSTGLYDTGSWPGVPAIDLNMNQIDMHRGDVMQVHMTYNGTTLYVTVLDTVTQASARNEYKTNLPGLVGGNTAYVGFTGGTGGAQATQQILSWTFEPGVAIAPPTITYQYNTNGELQVAIYGYGPPYDFYTTDGSTPTANSPHYLSPIEPNGITTFKAITIYNGVSSPVTTESFTNSTPTLSYDSIGIYPAHGFNGQPSDLLNGSAKLDYTTNPGALLLTDGVFTNQAGSCFYSQLVNVESFISDFEVQFTHDPIRANEPLADGMMFVVQTPTSLALGAYGAGLGFAGIPRSVGIKLDLYNNAGEGPESTGLYINGAQPTVPAFNLTAFDTPGSPFLTAYPVQVHVVYKKPTMQVTMRNIVHTGPFSYNTFGYATQTYTVDIPAIVGSNVAYVGFTGGTGGYASRTAVTVWSYSTP